VRIRLWKSIAPNRRPMALRVRRFDPGLPRPGLHFLTQLWAVA
jgi:hypothetical protein